MEVMYACSACRRSFPVDSVYDNGDGTVICMGCHARRTAPSTRTAAVPPQIVHRYPCSSCGGAFPAESLYDEGGTYICHACYARASTTPKAENVWKTKLGPKEKKTIYLTAAIVGIPLILILLIAIVAAIFGGHDDPKENHPTGGTTPSPTLATLPNIRVVGLLHGEPVTTASFSNWKYGGLVLSGTMVWTSGNIDAVTYTIRDGGVVKDRGTVSIPGGALVKNEPVQIEILTGMLSPSAEVTIEVEQ